MVRLDRETVSYFNQINNLLGSEDVDKESLANSAFEEMKGKELDLSQDDQASKYVENLLGYATNTNLRRFLTNISEQ